MIAVVLPSDHLLLSAGVEAPLALFSEHYDAARGNVFALAPLILPMTPANVSDCKEANATAQSLHLVDLVRVSRKDGKKGGLVMEQRPDTHERICLFGTHTPATGDEERRGIFRRWAVGRPVMVCNKPRYFRDNFLL